MTNFIPIFPLKIVVYPGEALNLHIFEPRYRQMIRECIADKKPFGLPPVMDDGHQADLGTLMDIVELVKEHPDGNLDIRTRGTRVFRMLEVISEIPEKLFSGAIVTYPDNVVEPSNTAIARKIVEEVRRLYALLNLEEKFPDSEIIKSYEIAHYVGLTITQEYELLGLFNELQRLEYIRRHLNNIVPIVHELESMKERIQRNGHFRNLSLDDL